MTATEHPTPTNPPVQPEQRVLSDSELLNSPEFQEEVAQSVGLLVTQATILSAVMENHFHCHKCDTVHGVVLAIPEDMVPTWEKHREAILTLLGVDANRDAVTGEESEL